jgi:hypothetical protein
MAKKPCCGNSSCCANTQNAEPLACPVCGKPGEEVPKLTVQKLVKPGLSAAGDKYFICRSADCAIVYFNPGNTVFKTADISVPVYFKTGANPVYACYCAGITKAQVAAAVNNTGLRRWADVTKAITGRAVPCRCEEKNPLGKCCSGNAYAAAIAELTGK